MSQMMTIGNNNGNMVVLNANDGVNVSVPMDIAKISLTIKNMLEDLGEIIEEGGENAIPLPNVSGAIVAKIFTFCDYIHNNPDEFAQLNTWLEDKTFNVPLPGWFQEYLNVEQTIMFEVILGANFLDIQPLLNMQCKHVAGIIRNKTPDELRKLFAPSEDSTVVAAGASVATDASDATEVATQPVEQNTIDA